VAQNDTYFVPLGGSLVVEAPGVLDNDTFGGEPAEDAGAVVDSVLVDVAHGTLGLNPDGSFSYAPGPDFQGIDSFTYQASVGAATDQATVTLSACSGGPSVFSCWKEGAFLAKVAELGRGTFTEGFESNAVWGGVRTPDTAPSVLSQGITWQSNHPDPPAANEITTGGGAAVSGLWGIYDPEHGYATGTATECDVNNPPAHCLYKDGVTGVREPGAGTLYGVGGFFTGTDQANLVAILDGGAPVGLGKLSVGTEQFFGAIDSTGFTTFRFEEIDGKVGQSRLVFADDFTIAAQSVPTPTPTRTPTPIPPTATPTPTTVPPTATPTPTATPVPPTATPTPTATAVPPTATPTPTPTTGPPTATPTPTQTPRPGTPTATPTPTRTTTPPPTATPTPTRAAVVTVPVIAHLDGVGGTPWRSDVVITNPGPDAMDLSLSYQARGAAPLTLPAVLGAFSTLLFDDMVVSVFGAGDGRGPLRVEPQAAGGELPVVVARTYAESPAGNLGSGLPATAGQGGEAWVAMPGLLHDAAYRSSVAVTAPTAGRVRASFDLFRGGDGLVATGVERSVDAGEQNQWTVAQLFPGLALTGVPMTVRAALTPPGGVAYASLVDNTSTDSAVYLGATPATSWIVPVVAHLPGREATFWSSDVAVWNAGTAPVSVDLEYLPENADNSSGGLTVLTIELAAHATEVLEDVVANQFGITDGKGALRVDASAPVVVTSRVATAFAGGGTSGNGVRCVQVAGLAPGRIVLPGVRTLGGFRTNIGIVTADLGATFELMLHGSDGILLGSKHLAVPARSLRQLSVRQLFGTAEQEVDPVGSVAISGDVAFTAYMTVIDGTSQDPVFVMPE
jgi:hypothetical protein